MPDKTRTLYVLVDFTDASRVHHRRGDAIEYKVSDREGADLLRRGILSLRPVRVRNGGNRNSP